MNTLAEMTEWVEVNGMDAFRAALAPGGAFNGKNKMLASAWAQIEAAKSSDDKAALRDAREVRLVLAAERSARVALGSMLISLAALAVAAWPSVHAWIAG